MCSKLNANIPSFEKFFEKIKKKGYNYSRTHIENKGFRTDMPVEKIIKILKN